MSKSFRLNRKFLPWLTHHFKEFIFWYLGAFLSLYLLQKLQVTLPLMVKEMTDGKVSLDLKLSLTFLSIALGIFVFRTLSRLMFFYPARIQQKYLRAEIIEALEATHPDSYQKYNSGQIYQVLYNDINNLRAFVGFALLQVGNVMVAAFVLWPVLRQFESDITITLLPMIGAMIIFSSVAALTQKWAKKASETQGKVQQFLMETYQAKATIKNFHREDDFVLKFIQSSKNELGYFLKSSLAIGSVFPLIKLGFGFSLLWGATVLVAQGKGASEVIFFSSFLFLVLEPLMFLSWIAVVTAQGSAAWKRIKELWSLLTPHQQIDGSMVIDSIDERCQFWDQSVFIKIKNPSWLILTGPTGVGKSYLLNSLANQLKLKKVSLSLVTQEPFMFNDTLEGNIFLGKNPSDENKKTALELLTLFGLHQLTPKKEDLLSLMVGENGKRLSGGEKKRVALIRGLMTDAQVFLWDDPFSAVDVIFERKIIEGIKKIEKFKKCFFIMTSHRLTTVKECHEFVLLDKEMGIQLQGSVKEHLGHPIFKEFFHEQMV